MKESIVLEIDTGLLSKAIESASSHNLNLSGYVVKLIKDSLNPYKGPAVCQKPSLDNGICLEGLPIDADLPSSVRQFEIQMMKRALKVCKYNQSKAANLIGIGKSSMSQKMKKYNLAAPEIDWLDEKFL